MPGHGLLDFARVGTRTVVTRMRANSPLVILTPRTHGAWAWAVCGTLGGGLVSGDDVRLNVTVGENATALVGTQASTKIYRSTGDRHCRQELAATVADNGLLVAAPDPVCCFAGAVYRQRQRIDLTDSGSLVLIDWLTSGRSARGERWQMQSYHSRTEVYADGRQVLRDATLLDAEDGPLWAPSRMGRFDCYAILVVLGRKLIGAARALLEWATETRLLDASAILHSAAPVASGGTILRAAGPSVPVIGQWLRERLGFLRDVGVDDPWARRH
jgi:urease accessory protein